MQKLENKAVLTPSPCFATIQTKRGDFFMDPINQGNQNDENSDSKKGASFAKTLEEVRRFFAQDIFATNMGAVIEEIGDGYAKCTLELLPCHQNAAGAVMGGAIFTLADFAFAVAANWNKPLHVSVSSQITYLGAAKGGRLIAEARKVKEGRSTCFYVVQVQDDLGNPVAHITEYGFQKG